MTSSSIFNFLIKSYNVGQEGRKLQKFEYRDNKKSIFSKIKNIFRNFLGLSFVEMLKSSGHGFRLCGKVYNSMVQMS